MPFCMPHTKPQLEIEIVRIAAVVMSLTLLKATIIKPTFVGARGKALPALLVMIPSFTIISKLEVLRGMPTIPNQSRGLEFVRLLLNAGATVPLHGPLSPFVKGAMAKPAPFFL